MVMLFVILLLVWSAWAVFCTVRAVRCDGLRRVRTAELVRGPGTGR